MPIRTSAISFAGAAQIMDGFATNLVEVELSPDRAAAAKVAETQPPLDAVRWDLDGVRFVLDAMRLLLDAVRFALDAAT